MTAVESKGCFPIPTLSEIFNEPENDYPLNARVHWIGGVQERSLTDNLFLATAYTVEMTAAIIIAALSLVFMDSVIPIVAIIAVPVYLASLIAFMHGWLNMFFEIFEFFLDNLGKDSGQLEVVKKEYNKIKGLHGVGVLQLIHDLKINPEKINLEAYKFLNFRDPLDVTKIILAQIIVSKREVDKLEKQYSMRVARDGDAWDYFTGNVMEKKMELAYLMAILKKPEMTKSLEEIGLIEKFSSSKDTPYLFADAGEITYKDILEKNMDMLSDAIIALV